MKLIYCVLLLFLTSCGIVYGPQSSFNVEDSKKVGVFIAEYKPENQIIKINDTITLDIREI